MTDSKPRGRRRADVPVEQAPRAAASARPKLGRRALVVPEPERARVSESVQMEAPSALLPPPVTPTTPGPVEDFPAREVFRPGVDPIVADVSGKPEPTHASVKVSRAGRNLPAAIGVGVSLILVLAGAIFLIPALVTPIVAIAVVVGALEVTNALAQANLRVPAIPLLVASVGVVISASVYGPNGLLVSTIVGVIVLVVWRVMEATGLMAVRDTIAGIFTLLWVPFLASFTVLLMGQDHGAAKVAMALAIPIANDVGGYVAGVFFGRHPMAPSISPKKSWEGFAGSMVLGLVVAGLFGGLLLPELGLVGGLVGGAIMVVVSTAGDLSESLLKRDLGIKDMGQLLPGHGGIMDRLDSMLLAAPTLFIVLSVWEAFVGS